MAFRWVAMTMLALPAAALAWQESPLGQANEHLRLPVPLIAGPARHGFSPQERLAFVQGELTPADRRVLSERARASLLDRPLDPAAIVMIEATVASRKAAQLALSERVSRREVAVQLLLMEQAAKRGADKEAFLHLDRMLTVSPEIGSLVYDLMIESLVSPDFRRLLGVLGDRPWFRSFLKEAIARSGSPDDVAMLAMTAHSGKHDWFAPLAPRLLNRLIATGNFAKARELARQELDVGDEILREFGLTAGTVRQESAPLTWVFADDGSSQVHRVGEDGVSIEVDPARATTALSRITSLPPGRYALSHTIEPRTDDYGQASSWRMECKGRGAFASTWLQPVAWPGKLTSFKADLTISEACPVQRWSFRVENTESQFGAWMVLSGVSLKRQGFGPDKAEVSR